MNDLAKSPDNDVIHSNRIGPMLVAKGKLSQPDLVAIARSQRQDGLRFGEAALKLGLVSKADITAVLAEQFAYTLPPASDSKLDKRLSALFQPDSLQAEALRSLRSELLMRYFHSQPNASLALLSCDNAAGLALTCANLAIGFAQLGHRTLLLDANLRDSTLNPLFGLHPYAPGLADKLAGRQTLAPIAVAEVPSLWLMPAGSQAPNPQELLAGQAYQNYLQQARQVFDLVLINTATMSNSRDAQLVAVQSGAALLIVHRHQTRTRPLAETCQRLRDLGVRLVGSALHL